ncbi:MAG: response regulator transcription factor [Verrucomicrobiota bacterium]
MTPNPPSVVTVAVVEDNPELLNSIREILDGEDGLCCVAACTSGEEAIATLPALRPEVVFMDINLPGINGVECVSQLVELLPKVLVVMLTIQSNINAVFQSLQAGACGYLHKPVHAKELVAAVREAVADGSPMTAGIARQVVQSFKSAPPAGTVTEELPRLTDRECEVLRLLTEGCLYKEIAERMGLSWHTVHSHIRRIYEKLQVRSRSQAIAKARERKK